MRRTLCSLLLLLTVLAGCESAPVPAPTPIVPRPATPELPRPTERPARPATPGRPTARPPAPLATRSLPPAAALTSTPGGGAGGAFQAGVSVPVWNADGYQTPAGDAAWPALAALGATWVAVVPTWYQADANASLIGPEIGGRSPTLASVRHAIAQAHAAGLRVMLKPHVDSQDDTWRGLLTPGDRAAWFASYTGFITTWAAVAAQEGADLFSVGTELASLSGPAYSADWRRVVAAVRAVYPGPLTYAANWGKRPPAAEYAVLDWWDALDYIGIDAYFPLSLAPVPTAGDLVAGWERYTDPWGGTYRWKADISAVQARWGRPVLFTEVGYASTPHGPAVWDAPTARPGLTPTPVADPAVAAAAYSALAAAWADVPWFAGFYVWQWYPVAGSGGPTDATMVINDKPAVLAALQTAFGLLQR